MLDLDMSPYAAFVWPAWGLSVLALAALAIGATARARRWKRELRRLEAEQADALSQRAHGATEPRR